MKPPFPGGVVGYYAVAVSSKNAICVGSIDTEDEHLSEFSSLGPTFDGRLKPDLVAPGAHRSRGEPKKGVLAASYYLDGAGTKVYTYAPYGGTSQAAPVVTGTIALMMQALEDVGVSQRSLRSSTFKAVLIHTARDLVSPGLPIENPDTLPHQVKYGVGPDYATGYGAVDAQAACGVISDPWHWIEGSLSAAREERVFCVDVPAGSMEVKATLVWDDAPASNLTCETCPKLVNDLDLMLVDPTGQQILPWVVDLAPPNTAGGPDPILDNVPDATRGTDRRNNVEMASSTTPQPGRWMVRVRAHELPLGSSQSYSLVTSPAMTFCWPRFPPMAELCELLQWFCDFPDPVVPHFDPERREWTWGSDSLLPLSELRKFEGVPPLHDDRGWLPGPGFELVVAPLPDAAILVLVDQSGAIVARGRAQGGVGRVRTESAPADREHYLVLAAEDLQPFAGPTGLVIGVEMLE